MKNVLLSFILIVLTVSLFAQSYMAEAVGPFLREKPDKESKILVSVPEGHPIFIISKEKINGFYEAIDIMSNTEGFIDEKYVKIKEEVKKNKGGLFIPSGTTKGKNIEIEVFNNTEIVLKLKMNEMMFSFQPNEKKTIKLPPGNYDYRASAPEVVPNFGTETLKEGVEYSWKFYITSR